MHNKTLPASLRPVLRQYYPIPNLQIAIQLFGAHWRRADKDWSFRQHHHRIFEINYLYAGIQEMTVGNQTVLQRPGEMVFVRSGIKHSARTASEDEMELFCLHFDVDDPAIRQMLLQGEQVLYTRDTALVRSLRPVFNRIVREAQEGSKDAAEERLKASFATFELFSALGNWLAAEVPNVPPVAQHSSTDIAKRIADEVEKVAQLAFKAADAMLEREGIKQIAEKIGYSTTHCNRVFQAVFGMSPRQYLSTLKLRRAKLLLHNKELTVEQIAELLGYGDAAHFSKQFKRWMKMSPRHYRQFM